MVSLMHDEETGFPAHNVNPNDPCTLLILPVFAINEPEIAAW